MTDEVDIFTHRPDMFCMCDLCMTGGVADRRYIDSMKVYGEPDPAVLLHALRLYAEDCERRETDSPAYEWGVRSALSTCSCPNEDLARKLAEQMSGSWVVRRPRGEWETAPRIW